MDDLMAGIGNSNGINGMDDLNELAKQAEAAATGSSDTQNSYGQQSTGYSSAQNSYGQQSTGYSGAQSGYGQQSTGYSSAQSGYGQQSTGYSGAQSGYGQQSTGYSGAQNSYGHQSTGYSSAQNSYGQQSTGYSGAQSGYGQSSGYGQRSTGYDSGNYGYDTGSGYSSSDTVYDFGSGETTFVSVLKGILGAVVGAIPGVILIIFVARLGFIAAICGAVLAVGIVAGYSFMTKNSRLESKIGLIICAIVMLLGVYIAVRTSWTMKISSVLSDVIESTWNEVGETELTQSEKNQLNKLIYGVEKATYSECSSHFSDLLSHFELKGKFILSLLENLLFAGLGGAGYFAKFGEKKI